MQVSYRNSWDEIWQALENDPENKVTKAAFEVKSAIEVIEQQKKMNEFQEALLDQQREISKFQKSLADQQEKAVAVAGRQTRYTVVLTMATVALVVVGVLNYMGFNEQTSVVEGLRGSVVKMTGSIDKLVDASEKQAASLEETIPNRLDATSKAVSKIKPAMRPLTREERIKQLNPGFDERGNKLY